MNDGPRCEERVWDNGDMTDCGKALPCPLHPLEQIIADRALDAVARVRERGYALNERYLDRLREIAEIVNDALVAASEAQGHPLDLQPNEASEYVDAPRSPQAKDGGR